MKEVKVLELLKKRVSHRQFLEKEISKEDLDLIISSLKRMPTSRHGQTYSVIFTRDKKIIKEVSNIVWQKYIGDASVFMLFVTDFYRFSKLQKNKEDDNEFNKGINPFIASNLNIGLAMGAAIIQAEELSIGTTCIGALRWASEADNKLMRIKELFKLPKHTFPTVGLILGYKKEELLPKDGLPIEAVVFEDKYDVNAFNEKTINDFNKYLADYYEKRGLHQFANEKWSESIVKTWVHSEKETTIPSEANIKNIEFAHHQGLLTDLHVSKNKNSKEK